MPYSINFIPFGSSTPARTWTGYATYQDARAALRDADAVIPIHWDHQIVEDDAPPPAPRFDYENACPTCGPTCCC